MNFFKIFQRNIIKAFTGGIDSKKNLSIPDQINEKLDPTAKRNRIDKSKGINLSFTQRLNERLNPSARQERIDSANGIELSAAEKLNERLNPKAQAERLHKQATGIDTKLTVAERINEYLKPKVKANRLKDERKTYLDAKAKADDIARQESRNIEKQAKDEIDADRAEARRRKEKVDSLPKVVWDDLDSDWEAEVNREEGMAVSATLALYWSAKRQARSNGVMHDTPELTALLNAGTSIQNLRGRKVKGTVR